HLHYHCLTLLLCLQLSVLADIPQLKNLIYNPFSVVVPRAPVYGLLGSSVTLPCSISPTLNAVNFEVLWFRPQEGHTPILFYQDLEIRKNPRNPQYQGRVSLIGGLDKGNVSVKLENIRLEDKGEYICRVEKTDEGEEWYDEATVSLQVKGQVNVSCESHGWTPKPSLKWTDRDGRNLKHLSTDIFTKGRVYSALRPCESQSNKHYVMIYINVVIIDVNLLCVCRLVAADEKSNIIKYSSVSAVNITIDSAETPEFLRITHTGKMVNCHQPKENHEEEECKIFTLCEEKFSSGQQYWELKVKEYHNQKLSWFVGVGTEEAERIHRIPLIPQKGFWVLCYEEGKGVYIRESPVERKPLPGISDDLSVIGVFLDCDNHTLSFYNAETQSLIYTYTSVTFRTSLRPLISPGIRDKIPVHICWINNPILASGSRKTKRISARSSHPENQSPALKLKQEIFPSFSPKGGKSTSKSHTSTQISR
uniref:Uncharacterized protein n=1 Tax=Astyanax mexicanus TaxID=7994 RepID=W5KIE1_ASTMX